MKKVFERDDILNFESIKEIGSPIIFFLGPLIIITLILNFFLAKGTKKREREFVESFENDNDYKFHADIPAGIYFLPDMEKLPVRHYSDEDKKNDNLNSLSAVQEYVLRRASLRMVKLGNHVTNKDIKKKYGIYNTDKLFAYEENFNIYIHALNKWAEGLIKNGKQDDAETVLCAAVNSGSEISKSYIMLSEIYFMKRDQKSLNDLLSKTDALQEPAKMNTVDFIYALLERLES